jgi:hypothetical protein
MNKTNTHTKTAAAARRALGLIVGLGLGYLAGWALNESGAVHQLIGAGLLVWLVGSLGFLVATVMAFLIGRRWR